MIDPSFKKVVDDAVRDRRKETSKLIVRTQDGKVLPFDVWARAWVAENIDGRKRLLP